MKHLSCLRHLATKVTLCDGMAKQKKRLMKNNSQDIRYTVVVSLVLSAL